MSRLKGEDTIEEMIFKMAETNFGAMAFMSELLSSEPNALLIILKLDSLELYGGKLYMLWSDCCNKDINKVKEVIDTYGKDTIHEHISGTYGVPFK